MIDEIELFDPRLDSFLLSKDILEVEPPPVRDEESRYLRGPILPCLPSIGMRLLHT